MPRERGWLLWQVTAWTVGLVFFVWPVLLPILEVVRQPNAWSVWGEFDRLGILLLQTLLVTAGSVLLALLLGGSTAFLLTRTDVPFRKLWIAVLGLALFIPLPLFTSGWYLVFQSWGAAIPALWPQSKQIAGAIFLHGVMGIPWATLVIGLGLLWVEPELEEEARLYGSFRQVFRRIIMPRCAPFVGLAALLVAWPTWHEITVTDFFKVQTLAEEVYLQLNAGSQDEAARAVAAVLPGALLMLILMVWALHAWRRQCPARWPSLSRLQRWKLGRWRWIAVLVFVAVALVVLLIPLMGMLAKAGMDYRPTQPARWSGATLAWQLGRVFSEQWLVLLQSAAIALGTGAVIAAMTLILAWLARGSSRCETILWWLMAFLWSIPGPVVGIGMLALINQLLMLPGHALWSKLLYSQPSPLPNIWASVLRYAPIAWMVIWPVARQLPTEWDEQARLEGGGPWRRLWMIYWPQLAGPVLWIGLAAGVLSLGEMSASKLITTPGFLPLSHLIFQQLHAGADAEVASLSLVLLLLVLLGGGVLLLWNPYRHLQRG
jgi:iron(III) transport system permease protein